MKLIIVNVYILILNKQNLNKKFRIQRLCVFLCGLYTLFQISCFIYSFLFDVHQYCMQWSYISDWLVDWLVFCEALKNISLKYDSRQCGGRKLGRTCLRNHAWHHPEVCGWPAHVQPWIPPVHPPFSRCRKRSTVKERIHFVWYFYLHSILSTFAHLEPRPTQRDITQYA